MLLSALLTAIMAYGEPSVPPRLAADVPFADGFEAGFTTARVLDSSAKPAEVVIDFSSRMTSAGFVPTKGDVTAVREYVRIKPTPPDKLRLAWYRTANDVLPAVQVAFQLPEDTPTNPLGPRLPDHAVASCDEAWAEWQKALKDDRSTAATLRSGHYTALLFDRNGVVCRANRDYVVGGDPILTATPYEPERNLEVDLGVCGAEAVGSVYGEGGFGTLAFQAAGGQTPKFRRFPTRQCYEGPVTFTVSFDDHGDNKISTVTKTKQMSLYPRYRLALQVGILYSGLHEGSFGLVTQNDKSFIVDQTPTGKGPEYLAALSFYALPRYIQTLGGARGLYKGRDPVHEAGILDRIGGVVAVGLTAPSKRAALGFAYEVLPGFNVLVLRQWTKTKELVGVDTTVEFKGTADKIPTRDRWSREWAFGISLDLIYAKKLLAR
jgi:hypothetical protein